VFDQDVDFAPRPAVGPVDPAALPFVAWPEPLRVLSPSGRFGVVVVTVGGRPGGSATGPMKPATFGRVALPADLPEPGRGVGVDVAVGVVVDVAVVDFEVEVGVFEVVVVDVC
jgi:hypothetical protein